MWVINLGLDVEHNKGMGLVRMGLFGGESREEKLQRKQRETLNRFGINLNSYDDETLRLMNGDTAREIAAALAGSGLYSFGNLLPGGNSDTSVVWFQAAKEL